jgi:diguanylate cyclase (GGDEF)-like protein
LAWWLQLALERRKLTETQRALVAELDEARRASMLDPMTQTWNRRGFAEAAARDLARTRRLGSSAAVMMLDIDHFKRVNDTYGHPEGDRAIRQLAAIVRDNLRDTDTLARFGGEEFAILVPEVDRHDAAALAEKLRAAVEANSILPEDGHFTISVGVSWFGPSAAAADTEQLLAQADEALYDAKRGGRNRVAMRKADSPQPG